MGRSGKKSVLSIASLFGLKNKRQQLQQQQQEEEEEEATAASSSSSSAARRQQQQRNYHGTRVRPSDDDDYDRHWYADPDINRRASEFIGRVHRGMLADGQDG